MEDSRKSSGPDDSSKSEKAVPVDTNKDQVVKEAKPDQPEASNQGAKSQCKFVY